MIALCFISTCSDFDMTSILDRFHSVRRWLKPDAVLIGVTSCVCGRPWAHTSPKDSIFSNWVWLDTALSSSAARNSVIRMARQLDVSHIWLLDAQTEVTFSGIVELEIGREYAMPFSYGRSVLPARKKLSNPIRDCTMARYIFSRNFFDSDTFLFNEKIGAGSAGEFQSGEDTEFLCRIQIHGRIEFCLLPYVVVSRIRPPLDYQKKRILYAKGQLYAVYCCWRFGFQWVALASTTKYFLGAILRLPKSRDLAAARIAAFRALSRFKNYDFVALEPKISLNNFE